MSDRRVIWEGYDWERNDRVRVVARPDIPPYDDLGTQEWLIAEHCIRDDAMGRTQWERVKGDHATFLIVTAIYNASLKKPEEPDVKE